MCAACELRILRGEILRHLRQRSASCENVNSACEGLHKHKHKHKTGGPPLLRCVTTCRSFFVPCELHQTTREESESGLLHSFDSAQIPLYA